MEERNLRVLEYNKIRELLLQNARSQMGAELCADLIPSGDPFVVAERLRETEEGAALLTRIGSHPIAPFDDVRGQLKRAIVGSTLSMRELLLCAGAMRVSRQAKAQLAKSGADAEEDPAPGIRASASMLMETRNLEEDIFLSILGEDEMADAASPALASIRRKIRTANERVREKLNSMIRSQTTQKYLQDPIITVRSGRFVLPVKQEYRQNVPGLIHDQSSSGATLFVEPMAIVEINNDLKTLAGEEQAEIERILMDFSARVADVGDALSTNLEILAKLDFIFAKAVLARSMKASAVKLNERGYLNIKRGRHPLIPSAEVVPIDIWLGEDFTTLVVTGPNTGGKTVTLKTVGLFALMTQAGLQIPCDPGSEMTVFDQVFADIGDEQSIEQSLSTFSSHMTNIVSILKKVTPQSLALFDELGAGTDPTEGAALAVAIIERLLNRKIRTMATTHYSEIKAFALMREGVRNASVEFSIETLRPTYKLSIGIPGKSNAFEISRRLGLMDDIIAQAQRKLSDEQVRFEDVISTAEAQRQAAESARVSAEESEKEAARLLNVAKARHENLEAQKQKILDKARDEAKDLIQRARAEAEAAIESIRRAAHDADRERLIQDARKGLRESFDKVSGPTAAASEKEQPSIKDIKPGQSVYLPHLNATGTALGSPNEKGEVQLQVGIMKVNAHISQLRSAEGRESASSSKKGRVPAGRRDSSGSADTPEMSVRSASLSCDVRGQLLEEAIESVERYLDSCILTGLHEVQIIHGKGTGALRAGLQKHLARHGHVEGFREGKYGEGDTGVTVVTLK